METHPREAVVKEKFLNTRKPSHWWVCGVLESQRATEPGGKNE